MKKSKVRFILTIMAAAVMMFCMSIGAFASTDVDVNAKSSINVEEAYDFATKFLSDFYNGAHYVSEDCDLSKYISNESFLEYMKEVYRGESSSFRPGGIEDHHVDFTLKSSKSIDNHIWLVVVTDLEFKYVDSDITSNVTDSVELIIGLENGSYVLKDYYLTFWDSVVRGGITSIDDPYFWDDPAKAEAVLAAKEEIVEARKALNDEAAAKDTVILNTLPDFGEDYIPSSKTDYTADDKTVGEEMYDIVEIIVSDEDVVIEVNGDSAYIDVFGKLKDGGYVNITNYVECDTDDDYVASWTNGRIIAVRKGKSMAELTYNGISKEIEISVKRQIIDSLPDFGEDYLPSSMLYYTIDDKLIVFEREEITEIIVSKADVKIEDSLYSAYIDVFGKLKDGRYIDITDEVKCTFEDDTLAMWIFGRIVADKVGTSKAVLTYNGVSTEINITVGEPEPAENSNPSTGLAVTLLPTALAAGAAALAGKKRSGH